MRLFDEKDPEFPSRLRELRSPPKAVAIEGPLGEEPKVAIVGTRRCSSEGHALSRRIARELARAGVVVVSGGAMGIDEAAHTGAMEGGGRTIVVLPSPIERPAPSRHRGLFRRVVREGGALVSEPGPIGKQRFFLRNRIIAALADLVLVVEAPETSGALHTVDAARELGRPLAAVPWAITHVAGAGCLGILRAGGELVRGAPDVLARLGLAAGAPEPADPLARALEGRGLTLEGLAAALGLDLRQARVRVAELEMAGRIVCRGGRFVMSGREVPGHPASD